MLFYNLVIRFYGLVIRLGALKNGKAAQWVKGRKDWKASLNAAVRDAPGKRFWIHCASYGEFEQGRPLIEAIRCKEKNALIVLSFFSPSGYEPFREWPGADIVCYLPLDTKRNASAFLNIIRPDAVIFIKYEFWINFLRELRRRKIKTYLVSAVFKPHHPFFKWYGHIFRDSLRAFSKMFLQDLNSGKLLSAIGVSNWEVCGDTRFDRVLEVKRTFQPVPGMENFAAGKRVIVAGSTWPGDETLILGAFRKLNDSSVNLVIVPHQVDENSVEATAGRVERSGFSYSLYSKGIKSESRVLIFNAMGMLSRVYHYAGCAYIGGGFNGGLHNVLEAAVYGVPVTFFGNEYLRYNEAVDLVTLGAARSVNNPEELCDSWNHFLNNGMEIAELQRRLEKYFEQNANISEKVLAKMNI